MIHDYSIDKAEISALISSFTDESFADAKQCIADFTETVGEEFLDDRSAYLNLEIARDEKLEKTFKRLATVCNHSNCANCPVRKYCCHYINTVRNEIDADSLKMVDLFCGAGGLSLGFTQEGFVTALANDIEACCIDTYAHNHPETPRDHIIKGDIRQITDHLETLLKDQRIDIVVGGPPCQSFSTANRQRIIDDPRNFLYKSYVEIVSSVRPPFFVMENVKGMLSVADQVVEDFRLIGYSVSYHILDAKNFGVPQHRERLIYIGNRVGVNNQEIFEKINKLSDKIPNYVLKDALFGLRPLKASRIKNSTVQGSAESGYTIEPNSRAEVNDYVQFINQNRAIPVVFNHKARYNNDRDIEIFRRLDQGDRSDDPKIADIMPYKRRNGIFKDKYFKLEENQVCKTITAHMKFDCNMYIHPTQARGLTPREAARVQSYPDDYFFRGAYTKTYMQIGNSVPPLLGRAIAEVLKTYVRNAR